MQKELEYDRLDVVVSIGIQGCVKNLKEILWRVVDR